MKKIFCLTIVSAPGGFAVAFLRDRRCITALEFAIVGPVLFLFIFAVLLTGIVHFWQLTLDDSVRNAARSVAIGAGSASSGVHSGSGFVAAVCGEFGYAAPNCAGSLQYVVQGASNFTGGGGITPASVSAAGNLAGSPAFSNIQSSSPFLVQVTYVVPITLPLWPMGLITLNGTGAIISAAAMVAYP